MRGATGRWVSAVMLATAAGGCGGDAGVELAAGDALNAVADQMQVAVGEYHEEVAAYDDSREAAMVGAFIARVQNDHADAAAMERHSAEFQAALVKTRKDRETEWERRSAAMQNVQVLREVGGGLQKLAIESLSLRDEVRRYLEGWVARSRNTGASAAGAAAKGGATR